MTRRWWQQSQNGKVWTWDRQETEHMKAKQTQESENRRSHPDNNHWSNMTSTTRGTTRAKQTPATTQESLQGGAGASFKNRTKHIRLVGALVIIREMAKKAELFCRGGFQCAWAGFESGFVPSSAHLHIAVDLWERSPGKESACSSAATSLCSGSHAQTLQCPWPSKSIAWRPSSSMTCDAGLPLLTFSVPATVHSSWPRSCAEGRGPWPLGTWDQAPLAAATHQASRQPPTPRCSPALPLSLLQYTANLASFFLMAFV